MHSHPSFRHCDIEAGLVDLRKGTDWSRSDDLVDCLALTGVTCDGYSLIDVHGSIGRYATRTLLILASHHVNMAVLDIGHFVELVVFAVANVLRDADLVTNC
jgi:hypothetical protein